MNFKNIAIICLLLIPFTNVYAQNKRTTAVVHDTLSVKERISIHTNAVDWILLTPNIGLEFDLSNMDWGRNTIFFSGKWNGNSTHTFKPSWVYNRMEILGEYRHYFRTEPGGSLRTNDDDKVSLRDRFDYLVGTKKKNPRIWRAYYWGAYASYGDYSLKFAKEGKQGTYISAGGSFGFGVPLYTYRNNSLDFEMGGSLGFVFTKYDTFTYDAESNCYPRLPEKSKSWHILPYPIPTNVRVSFVYRFHGIKNKYKAINHERVEREQQEKAAKIAYRDSINVIKNAERAAKQAVKDSIQQVKDDRKNFIKMRTNARRDSINQANLPNDSIKLLKSKMKLQAKEEEKLLKEKAKAEKEKAQKEKKDKKKKEKDEKKDGVKKEEEEDEL